jgi:hypothetical protein
LGAVFGCTSRQGRRAPGGVRIRPPAFGDMVPAYYAKALKNNIFMSYFSERPGGHIIRSGEATSPLEWYLVGAVTDRPIFQNNRFIPCADPGKLRI